MAAKVVGVQFADNSFVNFESNDEEWDRCQNSGVDGVFNAEMCQQKAKECGLHLTSTEVQSLVLGGFKEAAEVGCLYQVDHTGDGELNEKIPKYEKTPDGNICWSHDAVLLLISLYRQFEEKNAFSSGSSKKQDVWKAIAIEMNKHGYPYVSEQCDKKWRSLKYRYKHILENARHNRISRKKWEYFELMGEILEEDKSIQHSPLIISCNANGNQQIIPGVQQDSPAPSPLTPQLVSKPSTSSQEEIEEQDEHLPSITRRSPSRKRKRDEAPRWIKKFMTKQRKMLKKLLSSQDKLISMQRERNEILRNLALQLSQNK